MRQHQALPLGIILLCYQFGLSNAIWPFSGKRFTRNALIGAGTLGLDDDQGRVLAFGDFNGDQYLDVVTVASDQQTFSVNLWNHEAFTFHKQVSIKHSTRIQNLLPSDFNHDGKLDVLVMSQDNSRDRTDMAVYLATPTGGFDTRPINVPSSTAAQPIPLDIDGDLMVDMLGFQSSSPPMMKIWQNTWNTSDPSAPLFSLIEPPFTSTMPCTSPNPHSNAVLDFNGDCLADIFLTCSTNPASFQIWINNKSSGFSLATQSPLPLNIGQITFADTNRDGTLDMVFPTCSTISKDTGIGTGCQIIIVYNQQLPLCVGSTATSGKDKSCRKPDELCSADQGFRFDFTSDNPKARMVLKLDDLFPSIKSPGLLLYDNTFSPPIPQAIKVEDANLDGFPDLLFILAGDPHGGFLGIGQVPDRIPSLILSQPCGRRVLGCDEKGNGLVGYTPASIGAEPLTAIKDAVSVSFLDVDEDGTLDILVQRTGQQKEGTIQFIQNNFFYDAFFLKAIVLNGACDNGICTVNDSVNYMPFGVSYSGASYKYTILDTSGGRSAAQAGQLPQTSYQSLLTPYSFIGLGRTNNYIENLFVGSTIHADQHYINMEGVIPNSKVVIKPESSGKDWKKELYLRPGDWIPWVLVSVVGTMFVLSLIVLMLHISEKREDEMERRRASHMINFDAL